MRINIIYSVTNLIPYGMWRKQNPKAWRRLCVGQKVRYYRQFQKNTRQKGIR
jgi:hypothetical protein